MWRHYVYLHIRPDTNEIFYIGKGSLRKNRNDNYERANTLSRRNLFWNNIVNVNEGCFAVKIFAHCKSDKEAQKLEKKLISKYGRRDKGDGSLVNFTDGGDGHCGIIISEELRNLRSENASKPRSDKWVEAIRKARKNGGNGGTVKKGDRLPDSWRNNISEAVKGENNSMFGKKGKEHPTSRVVINNTTGVIYYSVIEASEREEINYKSLYNMLSGHRKNKTELRFFDGV